MIDIYTIPGPDDEIRLVLGNGGSAMRRPNTIDDLLKRVNKRENECWEWTGSKTSKGYGLVSWNGKDSRVHRILFEHFKGAVPDGMQVCHHCDNPLCCNPDHLYAGTARENQWDKYSKKLNVPMTIRMERRKSRRKVRRSSVPSIVPSNGNGLEIAPLSR